MLLETACHPCSSENWYGIACQYCEVKVSTYLLVRLSFPSFPPSTLPGDTELCGNPITSSPVDTLQLQKICWTEGWRLGTPAWARGHKGTTESLTKAELNRTGEEIGGKCLCITSMLKARFLSYFPLSSVNLPWTNDICHLRCGPGTITIWLAHII